MQTALLASLFVSGNNDSNIYNQSMLLTSASNSIYHQSTSPPLDGGDHPQPTADNIKHEIVETMSWQVTVLGFIASLAIAINLSTCFVHLRFRGRRSNFSSVILAISSLDIVFVAAQLGLSVATFAEPTKQSTETMENIGICTAGSMACRLVVLLPMIFILLESSFLAVGSFNRWLAISKPDVPHWVKGRTCLISIMAFFVFLTIAAGINIVRDDIIMVKDDRSRKNRDNKLLPFEPGQSNESSSSSSFNDYGGENFLPSTISPHSNSSSEAFDGSKKGNNVGVHYFAYGCSILPSDTALAVVSGISAFYFALLTISICFLIVTWFNIWSLIPLPGSNDGVCSVWKMVLRRKPEFVNSKFVDGYKIMWATLLEWIICSVCALAVTLAPLSASTSHLCLTRRFVSTALLFIAALFKCFLYIGFSFTFRRAIFETFVAPCCSRFYRTQNYVVARSSPFDRHMRVAVVGGREYHNGHHHHHRHHNIAHHFAAEKQQGLSPSVIPTVLLTTPRVNGGISVTNGPELANNIFSRRNNYQASTPGFNDPGACFDISDFPSADSYNQQQRDAAYLSPLGNNNNNGNAFGNGSNFREAEDETNSGGFTSLASLSASKSSSSSHHGGLRRIPIIIDEMTYSHNDNNIEVISSNVATHRNNSRSRSPTAAVVATNNNYRGLSDSRYRGEDNISSHSDVLISASVASPQPTMVGEEENKL